MSTEARSGPPPAVLGIDIGGSGIKGAPVDVERGTLLQKRQRIPTPQPSAPEAVAEVVARLARRFEWTGALGCAFPAVVQGGVARSAANVDPSWIGTDGEALFEGHTGCPVTLLNDADAAGLAEMRFGAGRGRRGMVVLLTLGTGIGSALFLDGRLIPNTELGHLILDGDEAEHRASARARKDEGLSWKAWAARLDAYLRHLESLFSPSLFILGGGVSKQHRKYLHRLTVATEVVPAEMRNDAGIVGAALAAARRGGRASRGARAVDAVRDA